MMKIGICSLCILLLSAIMQSDTRTLEDAHELYLAGDFSRAAKIYQAIIQQDPKCQEGYVGLIRSLWKNDNVQEAYKIAVAAGASFPENASLHAARGDLLFRMSRIADAQKAYVKAIDLDSKNARGYWGLGNICRFDFNRKSAIKMIKKAYECDPEDLDIFYDYIQTLAGAEQVPLLEKYLRLAAYEKQYKKDTIADKIEYFKKSGDLRRWRLKDPPPEATIPLNEIIQYGRDSATGYSIKALINGRKTANLCLDTGADGILIPRKFAEKSKLEIISSDHVRGLGDSGSREGYLAQAQSIQIGPLQFLDAKISVSEKGLFPDSDGIIGSSFFAQYLMTLNFPKKKMELRPLPLIDGKPYSEPETWQELDRTKCPEIASFQSMGKWGNLLIPTVIDIGGGQKKAGFFILDTGGAINLLSKEFAADLTSFSQSFMELKGVSGMLKAYPTIDDITLRIGGFVQKQGPMLATSLKDFNRDYGFEISGLIGIPLLKHLAITIDYRDGFINFEYSK
jgi:tetratricopeptide (TPR) repeat protein